MDFGSNLGGFGRQNPTPKPIKKRLLFGNILINKAHYSVQLPHGGLKQSGSGKDVSRIALDDYYDIKRISIKR